MIPGADDVLQEITRKRQYRASRRVRSVALMYAQPITPWIKQPRRAIASTTTPNAATVSGAPLPFDATAVLSMVPFTLLRTNVIVIILKIVRLRQAINTLCRRLI